jgi:hypothetical protein
LLPSLARLTWGRTAWRRTPRPNAIRVLTHARRAAS